jgi:hypothetical protein
MTVCIAAICDKGRTVVVAADRMFTSPPPVNIEFESDESKIERFLDGILVLPSGNTAIVTEILEAAKAAMSGKPANVSEIGELIRQGYVQVRAQKAEENIAVPMVGSDFLDKRAGGMSLPEYLENQAGIYQGIVAQTFQFNLGTELLLAGIDQDGARIAAIVHPGSIFWLDKLGYGATGSGAIHAVSTLNLCGQTRSHDLFATLHAVYSAKRAAEVAPGVGATFTDLAVLTTTDKGKYDVNVCGEAVLTELKKLWDGQRTAPAQDLSALKVAYSR